MNDKNLAKQPIKSIERAEKKGFYGNMSYIQYDFDFHDRGGAGDR